MSEAVLRSRTQYFTSEPHYKITVIPRVTSEAEISAEYATLVLETKRRRKFEATGQESSSVESESHDKEMRRWLWTFAVGVIGAIIVLGLVIGYLEPGPITGLILPIGVLLWWLLYKLAVRLDQAA
jgi:hypothetical protein